MPSIWTNKAIGHTKFKNKKMGSNPSKFSINMPLPESNIWNIEPIKGDLNVSSLSLVMKMKGWNSAGQGC